jgi:hypothetical protein
MSEGVHYTTERYAPRPDGARPAYQPAYERGLKCLNGEEFLVAKFPPREIILAPWLPAKGLAMIYAPRGIGKTWVALGVAHAIASGSPFLRWKVTTPRRVLHIDGEMPAALLQDRYAAIVAASGADAPAENFRIVAADFQPDGLPDLADPEAQGFYDSVIADANLIIVDNLSTVARGLRENEADSFAPLQGWLLRQRAGGRSVLVVHHAGKNGGQRGTSRKEDALDSILSLTRPPGYDAAEGARFEVRYSKSRGFWGEDTEPFEARLIDGRWITSEIVAGDLAALQAEGLSIREIAERTRLPKSTVADRLKRMPDERP